MKKGSIVLAVMLLVLATGALGAGASGEAPAKKRCHFVKKKVHGKIKRVRVCTKPKPKPKPKPAPKATNVTLTLDGSHAATATVGKDGGTVETQTASGAHITLTIPAGALDEDFGLEKKSRGLLHEHSGRISGPKPDTIGGGLAPQARWVRAFREPSDDRGH